MNSGSEKFSWKLYPGVLRVCGTCGKTLRVADVARVHTEYGYWNGRGIPRTMFLCMTCEGR